MRYSLPLVCFLMICFLISACNQTEPLAEPTLEPGRFILSYSPPSATVELRRSDASSEPASYVPVTQETSPQRQTNSYDLEPATYTLTVSAQGFKTKELEQTIRAGQTVTTDIELAPNTQAPVALFSATPETGDAPLEVTLDASSSSDTDGEIVSYRWDFGDGSSEEGSLQNHLYTDPGDYTLILRITDEQGEQASVSKVISVNAPPRASFTAAPTSGSAPLLVAFDASASEDSDGEITGYVWDFGDGTKGTGVQPSHTYTSAGAFEVSLRVTDDQGSTKTATDFIYVDVVPPQAAFSFSPNVVTAPEELSFDASLSQAGSSEIIAYLWDFGDGTSAKGKNITHSFATHGDFTVALTVKDREGIPAQTQQTVTINGAPTAKLNLSTRSGKAPLKVRFDASESSDPENDIKRYEWSLDKTIAMGSTIEHMFMEAGNYKVTLTITDGAGATASSSIELRVENTPPIAKFNMSPNEGFAPLEVSVDASSSSDPNDSIKTYTWDFGDGTKKVGKTTSHSYQKSGTFDVTLTVEDSYGAKSTFKKEVQIKNRPPNAMFSTLKTVGVAPLQIDFDASASSDTDGTINHYNWDFGNGDTSQGEQLSYTFTRPGTYSVKLTTVDNLGGTATQAKTISVIAPGGLEPMRVSSDDHSLLVGNEPFFWLGDTAWALWTTMTHDQVTYYLDDAKAKGFNVIQVFLTTAWSGNGDSGENAFGESPFISNDPTQLNPRYFDFAEWVIDQASQRDLYVAIMFGEPGRANDSRVPYPIANDQEGYDYGHAVGERLRKQTLENKIIWIGGQDRSPFGDLGIDSWQAMSEGLSDGINGVREFDQSSDYGTTLMSFHPNGGQSSSRYFQNKWPGLDFNGINTWRNYDVIVERVVGDFSMQPAKPTACLENSYEERTDQGELRTDWHVRFQGYWCVLSGAVGYAYGHHPGYRMAKHSNWVENLQSTGRLDMIHLKSVITSRPIEKRLPDQSLIISDAGQSDFAKTYIAAAKADDRSYAFIYSTQGLSFDLDLRKLGGNRVEAQWFDPREGTYTNLGTFAKGASVSFDPPGEPDEGNDWLLVLDAVN